jgi:predicted nucleic acid-binding Zn finger protein
MQLTLSYHAPSVVTSSTTSLFNFSPNLKRAPVFFSGGLHDPLLVRDALLNLHDLVISDYDTRLTAQDWERILDPVATVAPDELFFEAFSQDESSYGRVAVRPSALTDIDSWESGTTNIDFTPQLAAAIGSLRSGSQARFQVDPDAFSVENNGKSYREKKVKLPPSWLRGFLNVQSAMTDDLTSFELSRADLRNMLAWMKTHREKSGPRALVFLLRPSEKIEVIWEPWNHRQTLSGSVYHGNEEREIRLFGRRRLFLLNRVLPKMKRLRVFLAGSGMPSFWLADLGDEQVSFLCAISGWTTRPLATSGLHLSESQQVIETGLLAQARSTLRSEEQISSDELTSLLNIAPAQSKRILSMLCGKGQAMFDLDTKKYRKREVIDVALDDLGIENDDSRLAAARKLAKDGRVKVEITDKNNFSTAIRGEVRGENGTYSVAVTLNTDGRIVDGDCDCAWYKYNGLRGGPCKHILGLREAVTSAGSDVANREKEWWKVLI